MPDVVSLLGQITQPQEHSMQLRIGGISFFLQSCKKIGSETIRNHIECDLQDYVPILLPSHIT